MNTLECCACFMLFGVPARFEEARRCDRRTFYCPQGHPQSFTESSLDKLRRERDSLKQQEARLRDEIAAAQRSEQRAVERAAALDRRRAAAVGQVTRLKRRAEQGICPCCNRSFGNMRAHMAKKHPGYFAEPIDGETEA